jgi:hypothetical protein
VSISNSSSFLKFIQYILLNILPLHNLTLTDENDNVSHKCFSTLVCVWINLTNCMSLVLTCVKGKKSFIVFLHFLCLLINFHPATACFLHPPLVLFECAMPGLKFECNFWQSTVDKIRRISPEVISCCTSRACKLGPCFAAKFVKEKCLNYSEPQKLVKKIPCTT